MDAVRTIPPDAAPRQRSNPAPLNTRYRWKLLRAGPILLDGGGMFGVIPRVVWSRALPPDSQGRIELAHNCLLLHPVDSGGPVVIEVGSGNKFGAKMRKIFGLGDYWLADALKDAGIDCADVRHVIVSHLHFDHAGGLTRAAGDAEAATWTRPLDGSDDARRVTPTFPGAEVIVQRREWEDAVANRSVMTRTYLRENLEPIADQLRLIDSPLPFPPGTVPNRAQKPDTPLSERQTAVLPGLHVFLVPGHTWGQQAIRFTDDRNRTIVFVPDVLPTVHHAGPAYSLAYDVEPYLSSVTRHWLLEQAAENDWLLVLDHEPATPLVRVRPDGKGWYSLVAQHET